MDSVLEEVRLMFGAEAVSNPDPERRVWPRPTESSSTTAGGDSASMDTADIQVMLNSNTLEHQLEPNQVQVDLGIMHKQCCAAGLAGTQIEVICVCNPHCHWRA